MKKAGMVLGGAAAAALLAAAAAPEPILPLLLLSALLMAAGLIADSALWEKGRGAETKNAENGRVLSALRIVLLTVAAVFIFHGIMNGGMRAVLMKAARICMECIGLG